MIKKIKDGHWLIDFHLSRDEPRIRRQVVGPRSLAERIETDLRLRRLNEQFGWPEPNQITISDVVDLAFQDYEDNRRRSIKSARELRNFWKKVAGSSLADTVSSDRLKQWAAEWIREQRTSTSRVNRRMNFLLKGYRLAGKSELAKIARIPHWKNLKKPPPRTGFREWDEFVRVRASLPPHAKVIVTICYWTDMRTGEVMSLRWLQVKFDSRKKAVTMELSGADTKTGEPRMVIMGGDLYNTLVSWYKDTHGQYPQCEWVAHFKGRRVNSIRVAWQLACVRVGLGCWEKPNEKAVLKRRYRGALLHDFRRTALRNLVRAGVPEKVAMKITGHKTRAVFDRYNIVNVQDLMEAGRKVVELHDQHLAIPQRGHLVDTSRKRNA